MTLKSPSGTHLLILVAPALFVLIWSTGWIAAKFIAPFADPLTFLALRFATAGLLLGGLVVVRGGWPTTPRAAFHAAMSGILLHALYLGPVWWSIAEGVPAGIAALMAALQPLLTALLAPRLLGESLSRQRQLGIGFGLAGLLLVLLPKLLGLELSALRQAAVPLLVNAAGVVAVTFGTIYQKRFLQGGDLAGITTFQYVGALGLILPAAWLLEPMRLTVTWTLVLVLAWSVLALSIGAIALFLVLIRRGAVSRAAALIYLVPLVAALQAYMFFGETLDGVQMFGMGLTMAGVALAARK